MHYTNIKLENDFLLLQKWHGGHSSFANFQSIDLNLFLMESLDVSIKSHWFKGLNNWGARKIGIFREFFLAQ